MTALHGVLDCHTIVAETKDANVEEGENIFKTLTLSQLDIAKDIALLVPEGESERDALDPSQGLIPVKESPSLSCSKLMTVGIRVFGYPSPYTILKSIPGELTCVTLLRDRLPRSENRVYIEARQSPQLGIYILDVDADIVHGHSGAAVVDRETGELQGIIIGSLPDTVDNGWGIPWNEVDLKFKNTADAEFLNNLAQSQIPDALTSFFGYGNSTSPIPTPIPTIVDIQDQPWTNEYKIEFRSIGPFPYPVFLVIYMQGYSEYDDEYVYRAPFPANYGATHLVREISVSRASEVVRKVCNTGEARLFARLFRDTEPVGLFNPSRADVSGDELLEVSPSSRWSFRFIVDSDETYCNEYK